MIDSNISDQFFNWLGNLIPFITSPEGVNWFVRVLVIAALVLWVYLGFRIFLDASKRYKGNFLFHFIFFVVGVITGPIGLIIYNMIKPRYTPEEIDFLKIEHKFYLEQASHVLDCIKCNSYVFANQIYCTSCGSQNRFECEKCHTFSNYNDKFCFSCGVDFEGRYETVLNKVKEEKRAERELQKAAKKKLKLPTPKLNLSAPKLNLSFKLNIKERFSAVSSKISSGFSKVNSGIKNKLSGVGKSTSNLKLSIAEKKESLMKAIAKRKEALKYNYAHNGQAVEAPANEVEKAEVKVVDQKVEMPVEDVLEEVVVEPKETAKKKSKVQKKKAKAKKKNKRK